MSISKFNLPTSPVALSDYRISNSTKTDNKASTKVYEVTCLQTK